MKSQDIKTLRQRVLWCLEMFPATRNDDRRLCVRVWQGFYEVGNVVSVETICDLPSQEAIARLRRQIQHDDKQFPPTDEKVAEARGWNIQEWKHALGYLPAFKTNLFQGV